ncbi:MAG: SOS response-associated peptidase family protein [Kribbellaceae bacterium]
MRGGQGCGAGAAVAETALGLVPFWAKDAKAGGARMVNARAETVHSKLAYRAAFKSRRGLVPVDAFYEWFPTHQPRQVRQAVEAAVRAAADGRRRPSAGRAVRVLARQRQAP